MEDGADVGQPKERPERSLPRHKTKEKIEVDEGFVKGVEENKMPSWAPRPPTCPFTDPSRIRMVREHRRALIRKHKLQH
jgi:hypothetical protein